MKKSILLVFIIFLLSWRSHALLRCQEVFSNSPFQSGYHESSLRLMSQRLPIEEQKLRQELTEKIISFSTEKQSNVLSEGSLRRSLENRVRTWLESVEQSLLKSNINFDIVAETHWFENQRFLRWNSYQISESGNHWLNRIARQLKLKYDVLLRVDPILIMQHKATAFFDENSKTIYLNELMVRQIRPGNVTIHEILHAIYHAQREGRGALTPLPIHISFETQKPLDPQPLQPDFYSHYMSFEELSTYSFNVQYYARGLQKIISHRSLQEDEALTYRYWLGSLLQISRNVSIAAQQGMKLIQRQKPQLFKDDRGLLWFKLESMVNGFQLTIFIPKNQSSQAHTYAQNQLEKAFAWAQFHDQYFKDWVTADIGDLVQRSVHLRTQQQDFLKTFKNKRDPIPALIGHSLELTSD